MPLSIGAQRAEGEHVGRRLFFPPGPRQFQALLKHIAMGTFDLPRPNGEIRR